MYIVKSRISDPYFNLATEEFLLKNSREEFFLIWLSDPVVVVGKHQNTYAEINYPFIKHNQVKVARRLTGGGAVYHDSGNLNFTFIRSGEEGKLIDFKKNISPVVEALNKLGIPAVHGEKNDILLYGKKISGNAEHVYRQRILHHGTLLFNSNLENLNKSLANKPGRYIDKAVQSKRSVVVNISDYIPKKQTIDDFTDHLIEKTGFKDLNEYKFSKEEISAITRLGSDKYKTWEWIYGYSPNYLFTNRFEINMAFENINFNVERGIIKHVDLTGNYFPESVKEVISAFLIGKPHHEEYVLKALTTESSKIKNPEIILREFF